MEWAVGGTLEELGVSPADVGAEVQAAVLPSIRGRTLFPLLLPGSFCCLPSRIPRAQRAFLQGSVVHRQLGLLSPESHF